jgi:putative endonuclease
MLLPLLRKRLLTNPKSLGKWGEKQALKFLKSAGLRFLAANYSCIAGEIDLIMVDTNSAIVFIEVKTRADISFAPPEDVVNLEKQRKMYRVARHFLACYGIENRPYRFDVVAITLDPDGKKNINHFKNAFVM